jgi:uncharacterized protein YfaS (alpha-2-macroglobulin family)
MSQRRLAIFGIILIPFLISSICLISLYVNDLPNHLSQHETVVVGQNRLTPGSQAALRVVVRDSKDGAPLRGAKIKVSLKPTEGGQALMVFSGITNELGTAQISFNVPKDTAPDQKLIVETTSNLGSDTVERPVTVKRDYRVLLSTDKPIYQPGQAIHLRLLALSAFDLIPAYGQEVELIIADGKGNKVFRKHLTTTQYGVAAADFQLASEVNTGAYKITATLNDVSSEKTVTVENYVLPKFKVEIKTEKPYYLPGEHVTGSLNAYYFFGKPVNQAQVIIEGYTFDVQRNTVLNLQGTTDDAGNYTFEFDLPGYIAGSDLEGGLGRFYLQASLIDQANHTEISNLSFPVSQKSLVIEAIPEGGQFRPGVENILYVLTSYPDGSPAETRVSVTFTENGSTQTVETGPYGLAEVRVTPQSPWQQIMFEARDLQGNIATADLYFEGENVEESVLLRPDKPVYRVGDAMRLDILTSQSQGTVYLDVVREGQTVSTRSVDVLEGHAQVVVDLTPDLFGTLELHAYKILRSGTITRDTRLVVVDQAEGLSISFDPDPAGLTILPGDPASLNIQVNGNDGTGAQSALGIAIVDESVFALAEQDPGFAKLYFMLEQDLMVPKYDLHGFSIPDLVQGVPVSSDSMVQAIENTAQASLAAATPKNIAFPLQANSHQDAIQRAAKLQENYFSNLAKGLFILFLLVPLAVFGLNAGNLWRARNFWQSLWVVVVFLAILVMAFFLWPLGENAQWVQTPSDRIGYLMNNLGSGGGAVLLILGFLSLVGLLALVIIAIRQKDATLGWSLGLLALFIVVLGFLGNATTKSLMSPSENVVKWSLVVFSLLPLAFLLQFGNGVTKKQMVAALAALFVAIFTIAGSLVVLASFAMAAPMAKNNLLGRQEGLLRGAMPIEAPAAMATAAPSLGEEKPDDATVEKQASAAQPPRLRQYFPETMLWIPDAITDPNGVYKLDFQAADSITTWRITTLASTQDGRLGSTTVGLRVFQDFFIDLDLPVALTVGDEVSIPVGVYNYLAEPQTVRLELEQADWFELMDGPVKNIEIVGNDISVVYFRVKALLFGQQPFKVTAIGSKMSDAILKEVRVFPNGKQISFSQSDRLTSGTPVQQSVFIPPEAIPGTQKLVVKIYPGILSQVVEGLDSILRMPNGCFEQTSSTTYPNILVLDYLKTTDQISPEIQMKAEEYINLGYQRLTTFEVASSGGFSLFGDAPADRMLTAYGLQEFADMSRVYDIDEDLVKRAAQYLISQQASDGSWENDRGLVHENTWQQLADDHLPVTAYITWSLIEAGYGDNSATQSGIAYIRENQAKAEDAYVLALVANSLVADDLDKGKEISSSTKLVLDRLANMVIIDGNSAYWQSGVASFSGSEGQTGSIETTALAALAYLKSGAHTDLGNAALTYLVQKKDSFSTWYTTQATVLSLKALIQSVRGSAEKVDAKVTLSLNGGQTRTLQVTPENFDVVQLVSFEDVNPGKENVVTIAIEGEGNLMYQVTGGYYLPWEKLILYPDLAPTQDLVTIGVKYDRSELVVNDTVNVNVTISLNQEGGKVEAALIDLGLPPGFTVLTEDLQALVTRFNDVPADYAFPKIERFELTGRQILLYITNLTSGNPLQFSYRLRARFPLTALTPASNVYDYYNPDVSGLTPPQMIVVTP